MGKTYSNTCGNDAENKVKGFQSWGHPNMFKLLSKAWSDSEAWMKSTKAMEISGVGCVVQVTTQQGINIAEAVAFVPGVKIREHYDNEGAVTARELVQCEDKVDRFVEKVTNLIEGVFIQTTEPDPSCNEVEPLHETTNSVSGYSGQFFMHGQPITPMNKPENDGYSGISGYLGTSDNVEVDLPQTEVTQPPGEQKPLDMEPPPDTGGASGISPEVNQ